MADENIDQLFDNNRLPEGMVELMALCLYFPFGMLLAVIRIFIGFHTYIIACLMPKALFIRSIILRVMCGVLGIFITAEGTQYNAKKVRVLVANYTSTLDHLATGLIIPNVLPCVWDLPPALVCLLGYTDMGAKEGRDVLIQRAKKHANGPGLPMLVFPEGASTNGRCGLLKFSVWPFSLGKAVQPVLIKLRRPVFARITPSVLGGRWWIDIFWFLFVPYTIFSIRILPVYEQEEGETVEEYTRRLEGVMAKRLGIMPTSYTSADKVDYAKRTLFVQPPPAPQRHDEEDSALNKMGRQVKEVLPHVPMSAIKQDLVLTKDVDLTITNILEGRVEFDPDDSDQPVDSPDHSCTVTHQGKQQGPRPVDTAAKSFARNANERHLSLAERKQLLIETARRRYIEKHNHNVDQ